MWAYLFTLCNKVGNKKKTYKRRSLRERNHAFSISLPGVSYQHTRGYVHQRGPSAWPAPFCNPGPLGECQTAGFSHLACGDWAETGSLTSPKKCSSVRSGGRPGLGHTTPAHPSPCLPCFREAGELMPLQLPSQQPRCLASVRQLSGAPAVGAH